MEAADPSVTVDLMMRSLLAMGATPGEIAKLINRVGNPRAARGFLPTGNTTLLPGTLHDRAQNAIDPG